MGMFDIIIDESDPFVDRELQVKCFGKTLTKYRVGDTVVLYERLSDVDEAALAAEVDAFHAAAVAAVDAELGVDLHKTAEPGETERTTVDRDIAILMRGSHPRFRELYDGIASEHLDYQLAVSDGTFLTVRGGVLISTNDRRDKALRCVNGLGYEWDEDVRTTIISPADPLD